MIQQHNFNSGPSILPQTVLQQAAQAIIEYNNTGLSLLELGHRTTHFIAIIEEAKRVARAMEHNPEEMRRAKLREMFPELSDQEIENLLEKA